MVFDDRSIDRTLQRSQTKRGSSYGLSFMNVKQDVSSITSRQPVDKQVNAPQQVTNRTAFLIRRLMNDQYIIDLKKMKTQNSNLKTALKQQKQGHLTCLTEIIRLYQEKAQTDELYIDRLDKVQIKRDHLKNSKLNDMIKPRKQNNQSSLNRGTGKGSARTRSAMMGSSFTSTQNFQAGATGQNNVFNYTETESLMSFVNQKTQVSKGYNNRF